MSRGGRNGAQYEESYVDHDESIISVAFGKKKEVVKKPSL